MKMRSIRFLTLEPNGINEINPTDVMQANPSKPPLMNKGIRRIIFASSAGTMIEWYDFYIFGSLATIISTEFFPKENPTAAFLATLAAFGIGFVVRPFGAIVFGRL